MIKVSDKLYINADTNQYILQERIVIQDKESANYGKEFTKSLGYYTSLEGCLNGILKTKLREFISKPTENSIDDLLKEVKKIEIDLKKFKNI